jgi:hypothetical protein
MNTVKTGAKPAPLTRTLHGFAFGAAAVTADASDERGNAFVGVWTPRAKLSVHVTPTGLLRIVLNGKRIAT